MIPKNMLVAIWLNLKGFNCNILKCQILCHNYDNLLIQHLWSHSRFFKMSELLTSTSIWGTCFERYILIFVCLFFFLKSTPYSLIKLSLKNQAKSFGKNLSIFVLNENKINIFFFNIDFPKGNIFSCFISNPYPFFFEYYRLRKWGGAIDSSRIDFGEPPTIILTGKKTKKKHTKW